MKILTTSILLIAITSFTQQLYQGANKETTPKITVLKNGFIIDVQSNGQIKKGTIVLKDKKIEDIFYTDNLPQYSDATIIDVTGKYVMPGLIETHTHLATVPKASRVENQKEVSSILNEMLFFGITTIRDMAGNAIILADYKRASALNQLPAPEIFYAAMFAGPKYLNEVRSYETRPGSKVDTPWEQTITKATDLKLAVAMAKGAGASGVKIYNDLSADLVLKITKEAHKQGLLAWSHAAVFPASPWQVASAKVNSMSHASDMLYGLDKDGEIAREDLYDTINYKRLDRLLLLMKENNVVLDATNYTAENNDNVNNVKITKRANELGVKVSVGTDWPYLYDGIFLSPFYEEINLFADKCGFTNAQILHSATVIGAESIGLTDRGILEKGKRADVYILNTNPLENIDNLKDGYMVVKAGKTHIIKK